MEVGLAIMASRMSGSVTFKGIFNISVGAMKTAIENITSQEITVFQSLGNEEFLVELTSKNASLLTNFMFVLILLTATLLMLVLWVSTLAYIQVTVHGLKSTKI